MIAKKVYESIEDLLKPKSREDVLASLKGRKDAIFRPTDPKKDYGTSLSGEIETSYKTLVKLFGKPNSQGDEYKVSSEWVLEDDLGNIATIYDYKATNLYDEGAPSVAQFRKLPSYSWHIGTSKGWSPGQGFSFLKQNTNSIVEDLRAYIYLNS